MHEKHEPPSQPSAREVHRPIFPGEYSQFCPSFVHALAGFCGDPSLAVLIGVHAASESTSMDILGALFLGRVNTYLPSNFAARFSRKAFIPSR